MTDAVSVLKALGLSHISVLEESQIWIGEGSYGTVLKMKLKQSPGWVSSLDILRQYELISVLSALSRSL